MPNWLFLLQQLRRRLWVTVALYCALGVAASLISAELRDYVPAEFPLKLGSDSVDDILSILASSMLAVATFALTTLVTAYTSISANLSPRAALLLVGDSGVRNPLGTFVGAFIYSVVGIIAVHTGYYGAQGRVLLYFVTLAVLALVVLAMVRWIGQISSLAQSRNVIDRLVKAAQKALAAPTTQLEDDDHGEARPPPPGAATLQAHAVGFVQNIDVRRLNRLGTETKTTIRLEAAPGFFVHGGAPLMSIEGPAPNAEGLRDLRAAISIGPARTFEQDPLFALEVLGEIAARALSPGVNDPGTAREVMHRTTVMLSKALEGDPPGPELRQVRLRTISCRAVLEAYLGPVARDGAGDPSLQLDLQAALCALAQSRRPQLGAAAAGFSQAALGAAMDVARAQDVRERLVRAAAKVARCAAQRPRPARA